MIDFYYWTTPNGHKISIFLEESGLQYQLKPINIGAGEQFGSAFLKISSNIQRWMQIMQERPAVQRAYALIEKINPDTQMTEADKRILFGQNAKILRDKSKL